MRRALTKRPKSHRDLSLKDRGIMKAICVVVAIAGFQVFAADLTAQAQVAEPIRVSSGVQDARLIEKVEPEYPPIALKVRLSGSVELEVSIDREGKVTTIEPKSGHPLLVQAAIDAVKQWHYKPPQIRGEPVAVSTIVKLKFELPRHNPGAEAPIRVASGVQAARLLRWVAPEYPADLKLTGEVVLQVTVDREGRVKTIEVISGHPLLAQSALDSVKQWRYKPALVNRKPVEVVNRVVMKLHPPDPSPDNQP